MVSGLDVMAVGVILFLLSKVLIRMNYKRARRIIRVAPLYGMIEGLGIHLALRIIGVFGGLVALIGLIVHLAKGG